MMKYNVLLFISYLDVKIGGIIMNFQSVFINSLYLLGTVVVLSVITIIVYETVKQIKGKKHE